MLAILDRIGQGLDVDGDDLSPEFGIVGQRVLRLLDHQVDFQRDAGRPPDRLDDNGPVGELGHKPAVHDVQMEGLGSGRLEAVDLPGQMPEITEQQGWQHDRPVRLEDRRHSSEILGSR